MSDADIAAFTLDLNKFIASTRIAADVAVRKIAFDLFSAIVKKTPVDTGRARSSWTVGVGYPNTSVAPETKRKRSAARATEKSLSQLRKLARFKLGQSIYLLNNLDYVIFLEEGSSKQAPYGMVRLSIGEIRAQFRTL